MPYTRGCDGWLGPVPSIQVDLGTGASQPNLVLRLALM